MNGCCAGSNTDKATKLQLHSRWPQEQPASGGPPTATAPAPCAEHCTLDPPALSQMMVGIWRRARANAFMARDFLPGV